MLWEARICFTPALCLQHSEMAKRTSVTQAISPQLGTGGAVAIASLGCRGLTDFLETYAGTRHAARAKNAPWPRRWRRMLSYRNRRGQLTRINSLFKSSHGRFSATNTFFFPTTGHVTLPTGSGVGMTASLDAPPRPVKAPSKGWLDVMSPAAARKRNEN